MKTEQNCYRVDFARVPLPPLCGVEIRFLPVRLALVMALSGCVASSSASILSVAGNDTLVGNRALNLIVNGSFEADGGVAANGSYWATGTTLTPTMPLTGWTAAGQTASYAYWGSDGFGGINLSAAFPDGTNGLYFGGGMMASVSPYPTEAANGLVTFSSPPVIVPKPNEAPVTLLQTVSGLSPGGTYLLDFWTSGEDVGTTQFPVDGFFGLDITGESRLYFAAPSGNGPIGTSQRYQVVFQPTGSTVTFKWINWGHFNGPGGLSDEIVLDDVILNVLTNAPPPLDYHCFTNLPNWTVTCPAHVPDLCALAASCFSSNHLAGSCIQNIPPGAQLSVGSYPLTLQVQDLQSNVYNYTVTFTVVPPMSGTNLIVVCPTNKTVECGSDWSFDSPVVVSSCCDVSITSSDSVVSNSSCSLAFTRVWSILDGCGNATTCSQTVTTQDTTPPGTQCGQNLVPNHSFEHYTNCPGSIGMFNYAVPWFQPTPGTVELFSPCSGPSSYVSVPTNSVGVQAALTGQCYAGAVVWSVYGLSGPGPQSNYREYLEVPLLAPLTAGQKYQVSFYVSRADKYHYAIAEIGAALTFGPLTQISTATNFNIVPQVENPSSNLLADTNSWMLVQGTFTALGGESYLTLGNFRTDANTTYSNFPAGSEPDYAYYYFDEVSVTALCNPMTNKVVQCGEPWAFDNVTPFDNCSGTNVSAAINTTTNGFCPKVITRTWSLADACGNTNLLTQTVTIVDTNPPVTLCSGVNLVPNGNFESHTTCPQSGGQIALATPWFAATDGTCDYYNSCALISFLSTPTNGVGNQIPLSGQGYAGLEVFGPDVNVPGSSYREYMEVPLISSLIAGQTYRVSFHVSRAENYATAIAELGAYLSAGPIVSNGYTGVLNFVPQVVNPPSNVLLSTTNWMLVTGTFVAAGGESYLTLGNFLNDAGTTAVPASGLYTNFAYYYFDDVSVVPLCPGTVTNKTVQCGAPWTFDPPTPYDQCSGTNVTITVASTVTNGFCPLVITRTWALADPCGNTGTWSQTVSVVSTNPPVVNCGCLQDTSIPLFAATACSGVVPDLTVLTNSICITGGGCGAITLTQSPAAGTVVGSGLHNITVNIISCGGGTNTCVWPFYVNPPPTITCPANIYVFGCSNNSAIVHFNPTATGNTGPVICSPPSGSIFPLGDTIVTCTATNNCGVASCTFKVHVTRVPPKIACITKVIGVIGQTPVTARVINLPPFPGGGLGVDLADLTGTSGMWFDLGPAQKFTFSTWLDFTAPEGASFSPALPADSSHPNGTPLLSFALHSGHWEVTANKNMVDDTSATFRSIAIGTNGELFSSFTHTGATLDTNILARILPMNGTTGAVMTVTLDFLTREMTLAFPSCAWVPDAGRKGWDGYLYGNTPRASLGSPTANLILTPLTSATQTPITTVTLLASNLATLAFDNPTITDSGHIWSGDEIAYMHAYAGGTAPGMEIYSLDDGGGASVDLGHAASFQFNLSQLQDSSVSNLSQTFAIRGWPPGTTTNRPPPPVFNLRLAQNSSGTGGVDCFADFSEWGVSNVIVQLWNGTALVAQAKDVPASLTSALVTLSGFTGTFSCPSIGVVSLTEKNPIVVLAGLKCSSGCTGTELRITAETTTKSSPPTAFTGLDYLISAGMDNLVYGLQTTPACSPVPIAVNATVNGITLGWQGDGFRLQGAESLSGPWYDLGANAPVMLPANSALRFFRLLCD